MVGGGRPVTPIDLIDRYSIPVRRFPAELSFENIPGGGHGEDFDERNGAGRLVPGDEGFGVGPDLHFAYLRSRLTHDHSVHPLAPLLVGYAHHGTVRHCGVAGNSVFHLGGIDVLATCDDHIVDPVDDVDVTVGVHPAGVSCVHPTAA